MNAPLRLLLVDRYPLTRLGFERLLDAHPDLMLAAWTDSADDALQRVDRETFAAVVLDVGLRRGSGLDLIGQIRVRQPDLPILVYSALLPAEYEPRVLRAGAQAFLSKEADPSDVVPALRQAIAGGAAAPPRASRRADALSDREAEVVRLIGQGLATREIAHELNLSVKTIESYRANIKRKRGLRHSADLARFAYDWLSRSGSTAAETRASIPETVSASSAL